MHACSAACRAVYYAADNGTIQSLRHATRLRRSPGEPTGADVTWAPSRQVHSALDGNALGCLSRQPGVLLS